MTYTNSIAQLDEEVYALQRHYDTIHRYAERSGEAASDLAYRVNEIKVALKDTIANDATFSNDPKRAAELKRRLNADFRELCDDEASAARAARQDRAELERSEQALKTALVRLRFATAQMEMETARIGLEAAQANMPRFRNLRPTGM